MKLSVVDCHAHFIPPSVIAAVESGVHAGVELTGGEGAPLRMHFSGLPPSPPIPRVMSDLDAASAWQRDRGVDVQLLSPWTDLFGYTLPVDEAVTWSDQYNDELIDVTSGASAFRALATVPLGHPAESVGVLDRALDRGAVGIMIGTRAPGMELDDLRLEPLWNALVDRQVPAVIHPIFLGRDPRLEPYGLHNAVGRANETAIAVSRLLHGGVLERHPDLRLVVVHGGGAVPVLAARLARNHAVFHPDAGDPSVGLGRLHFDSVVLDPVVLASLVERVGSNRIVLGSDYPFPWEPHPRSVVNEAGLGDEASEAILGATAIRLFGLDHQVDNVQTPTGGVPQ